MKAIYTRCRGCGEALPPGRRARNPRQWCSEKCRVKTYYTTHPEKADERRRKARKREAERAVRRARVGPST